MSSNRRNIRIKDTAKVLKLIEEAADSELSELSDNDDDAYDDDFQPYNSDEEAGSDDDGNSGDQEDDENEEDDDDELPLSRIASRDWNNKWKHDKLFKPKVFKFQSGNDDATFRTEWTPMVYVRQYLDNELFDKFSECTNVGSTVQSGRSLNTTAAEIKRFVGANMMMSCLKYPQ